jgi:hypothetical protein
MRPRLLRALARGGCVAQRTNGQWSVWRSIDRRGAIIGDVEAHDIDSYMLSGALKPLGGDADAALIWCGGVPDMTQAQPSSQALLNDAGKSYQAQSLLMRLLCRVDDVERRQRLRNAALAFEGDVERSLSYGGASGMNWQALAAGTRIDGGTARESGGRIGHAGRAASRLSLITAHMNADVFRLLERMIVQRETRYALAKWRGARPVDIEREALTGLRQLARLYDTALSPVSRD